MVITGENLSVRFILERNSFGFSLSGVLADTISLELLSGVRPSVCGEIKGYGMIVMLQDKRSFRILFFQFCGFDDLSAVKKGGVEEISKSIIIALEIF